MLFRSQNPAPAATASGGVHDLIFLAENRPVFLRLRITRGDRPFEASWIESVQSVHKSLDRDGDGTLTVKEADPALVLSLVRLAKGAGAPPKLGDLDAHPKDGKVSIDELAEGLRSILGPFELQTIRQAVGRTDALFDQLDRDKDGQLTRSELSVITGSLRPLDLDDDQMISTYELEPFNNTAMASVFVNASMGRVDRALASPTVVELLEGESTLRPARLLLKRYDKPKDDIPGSQDNKLSPEEFAINPDAFAAADRNRNGSLELDELRKLVARPPLDLALEVTFPPDSAGRAKASPAVEPAPAKGVKVRQIDDGDIEVVVGQVRVDVQVYDAAHAAEDVRRMLTQQFKALDSNKDGYLEGKEQAAFSAPQSPLSGLSIAIDRDGDGKIYLKELLDFADRQSEAARGRLVATAADQGRAIFGIVDLDRDRRLGARELLRTLERVTSWDGDSDGRVSADEIPYHFQVNITRGGLIGLTGEAMAAPVARPMAATGEAGQAAGPIWFQKMDRNHDGDVSRREFLGPRDVFDRLDRDTDGLIDADEASKAADTPRDKSGP